MLLASSKSDLDTLLPRELKEGGIPRELRTYLTDRDCLQELLG
jgi:hypothetical protein